jgi:hypothetical protein
MSFSRPIYGTTLMQIQLWPDGTFKKTICKGVCTFKCTEKGFFNQE